MSSRLSAFVTLGAALAALPLTSALAQSGRTRTTIDLGQARTVAVQKIQEHLGTQAVDPRTGSFLFVDGAAATEEIFASDFGRLYFVMPLTPAFYPDPTVQAAYSIGLDGTDEVKYVRLDRSTRLLAPFATSVSAVIRENAAPGEVDRLVRALRARAPDAAIEVLNAIGVLLVASPTRTGELMRILKASPTIQSADIDAEMFAQLVHSRLKHFGNIQRAAHGMGNAID